MIVLFKPDDSVNERDADAAADNRGQDWDCFDRPIPKERLEIYIFDGRFGEIAQVAA